MASTIRNGNLEGDLTGAGSLPIKLATRVIWLVATSILATDLRELYKGRTDLVGVRS